MIVKMFIITLLCVGAISISRFWGGAITIVMAVLVMFNASYD